MSEKSAMHGKVTIVAHRRGSGDDERGSTNRKLAGAWLGLGIDARILPPAQALVEVAPGEVVLNRLDVLDTLDGIEPGLEVVAALERLGARVLNPPAALRAAHDKLETATILAAAGLPHPRTAHVARAGGELELAPPVVVKPRHGSWGRDVCRCESRRELAEHLEALRDRSWFREHGALVQELLPPRGYDLRLVVANGRVVAAAERVAGPGEWRTNVSLGGRLRAARPEAAALALGVAAAVAIGADLVGVDLVPTEAGYVVLELNGAVDFDDRYRLHDEDVYTAVADALGFRSPLPVPPAGASA